MGWFRLRASARDQNPTGMNVWPIQLPEVPINPAAEAFDGGPDYPGLRSIFGGVDGVAIPTQSEVAERWLANASRWWSAGTG